MRAAFTRAAALDDVVRLAAELAARTMIFDVEPLVAYWNGGQDALDEGVTRVLSEVAVLPAVRPGERSGGIGASMVRHVHDELDARGIDLTLLHYAQVNPLSAPFLAPDGVPAAVVQLVGPPGVHPALTGRHGPRRVQAATRHAGAPASPA